MKYAMEAGILMSNLFTKKALVFSENFACLPGSPALANGVHIFFWKVKIGQKVTLEIVRTNGRSLKLET